jgi:hypothetical protein
LIPAPLLEKRDSGPRLVLIYATCWNAWPTTLQPAAEKLRDWLSGRRLIA